jgi:valyl-tRNA synthetase
MLHPFMPYVTEEIYGKLPIKEEESITISKYPIVEENLIFANEQEQLDKILEDIVAIRNLKATNQITKEAKVKVEVNEDIKDIYFSQLKIKEENLLKEENSNLLNINYKSKNIDITYFYEGSKEDESKKDEEIKKLVEDAYVEAERILKENMDILTRVAEALLLVETIDGQQFEALFTGEVDAEGLAEKVRVEGEAKKARDEEEAAETERLRKEEEERLKEELEKYDTNYLADDEEAPLEELEINEKVNEDESNS